MQNQHFATQSTTDLRVHSGDSRLETFQGRDHVVAPATLVREMVLKGHLLPFEEIERTALAWNGHPVTVAHPTDDNGDFLPASASAEAFAAHAVGKLFDVGPDPDGRGLDGEVWLDAEASAQAAEELDRDDPAQILQDSDGPIEVSTGYWFRKAEGTGTYDGQDYQAVQKDVQPDHLAILPNSEGECSLDDGCGLARPDHGDDSAAAAAAASGFESDGQPAATGSPSRLVASLRSGLDRLTQRVGVDPDDTGATQSATLSCNCSDDCQCGGDAGDGDGALAGNQDVGDAVRWESDAGGSVGGYRYGVIVDGLQDEADGQVLVAVYQPADDGDGWENRNEQNPMDVERLEVVGSDGVGSLPPIDQVRGNVVDDSDPDGSPTAQRVVVTNSNSATMAYNLNELSDASGLPVATLEEMDDDELDSLAGTVLQDDGDGSGDGDGDDGGDSGGNKDGDPDQPDDDPDAATNQELLDRIAELEAQVQAGASPDDLEAELRDRTDLSDATLEAMDTSEKAALARDLRDSGGVYAGRRGAASNSRDDDDAPPTGASLDALEADD